MSNQDYTSTFERACAYPFVADSMFEQSSRVHIGTGGVQPVTDNILITPSLFDQQLPGTQPVLPGYDLTFTDGTSMKDRVAVIAIGSNSSPEVLLSKFNMHKVGGDFLIAQALIENHAVAHGAFVGAAGTIPATIVPHKGSNTQITVSFLTPEQAEKLTGTEHNYDLVQLHSPIYTRGFANRSAIPHGALAYVTPWRSLSKDGVHPLALTAIPAETSLERIGSAEAAQLVAQRLKATMATADFFNTMALDIPSRLCMNYPLQLGSIPAHIAGMQVKNASITIEAKKRGLPAPELTYLK